MLQAGFASVWQASSEEELRTAVVRFAQQLGFQTVSASTVIDHLFADSEFITLDNTPPAWESQFQDRSHARLDPVMQHCKRASVPIVWDQDTYVKADRAEMWETQASHGYQTGIALALHLPGGRHFFIGVDRDQPLPSDPVEVTRMVADLQLFAVYAQDAAQRVLVPPPAPADTPNLTPRELEALRWTMEGKTAWEVGSILGITERTAVLHINNATHKMGCVNKHQAVLKAIRMGLLR